MHSTTKRIKQGYIIPYTASSTQGIRGIPRAAVFAIESDRRYNCKEERVICTIRWSRHIRAACDKRGKDCK